jgi:uncharacterized membrane protein YhaH (DUF805 family)
MGALFVIVYLAVVIAMIASIWKTFEKAGKPGWAAIVPIYNIIVMLEIGGKPTWWIVLFLIPIANFIVLILINLEIAKKFGQSSGFGIGMCFLPFIFWPMLGFGSAQYQGASTSNSDHLIS